MRIGMISILFVAVIFTCSRSTLDAKEFTLKGSILDSETGKPLPARVYIRAASGKWLFVDSSNEAGSAVRYDIRRSATSVERHTTISAHPFTVSLPEGTYSVTIERGKEYIPIKEDIVISDSDRSLTFRMRRMIDMTQRGWFSGETHVHRSLAELPNAMLADDLNVALPLTYWVTTSHTPPSRGDKSVREAVRPEVIEVDPTHLIYPMNTEYEIFSVAGKRHTLGAIFALGHKTVFQQGTPPVRPIAEQVRREGGLLELDKHNWPWSMMLVPVMDVDLYELTNNHIWRAPFHFRNFGEPPAGFMKINRDENGISEQAWIDFTFQHYYALLNCGFRLRPTAGTASGVHPVPLGFGRVYVHLDDKFSYENWMKGLDAGRSFVTTGPLLFAEMNGKLPGESFSLKKPNDQYHISAEIISDGPLEKVEIVVSGEVVRRIKPTSQKTEIGSYSSSVNENLQLDRSAWIVVRCYQEVSPGRFRFAHSAPWHVDIADRPLLPSRVVIDYFIQGIKKQIRRSGGILSDAALEEYKQALRAYQNIATKSEE